MSPAGVVNYIRMSRWHTLIRFKEASSKLPKNTKHGEKIDFLELSKETGRYRPRMAPGASYTVLGALWTEEHL